LLTALAAAGIPAGPINDVAEVFADPQVVALGLQLDLGGVPGLASPIVINGRRQVSDRPSPGLPATGPAESTS
jgi:crotonobetainyl-CoA:carnitine CoA-transferase CaiB-like acyl-CoA transferase